MTLLDIITECAKRKISVEVGYEDECGLTFRVEGFAKSGIATLKERDGVIECHTRYSRTDIIEDFDGLAQVAFSWYLNYKDRGYGPGPFEDVFVEKGWLTVTTRVVKDYTV